MRVTDRQLFENAAREAQSTLPELIDAIVHTPSFRSPAPLDPAE